MRARLIPLDGGPPLDIVKDLVVVGRKEDCDVRLDHKSVSKQHCVIIKTDGMLFLRDLGSTNGTRVNGTRVRRAGLLPDDQLAIAHFKFRVYLGPDVPQPVANQHAHEHTQALDPEDVAELLRHARNQEQESDEYHSPPPQRNALPDAYPNED